jgi:rRNA maturation RNase YbeY
MPSIRFFSDGISFQLKGKRGLSVWLKAVATGEGKGVGRLNYVFVSADFIRSINSQYLQHDTDTDIISFDDSEGDVISGEMYVCVETVRANAKEYEVDFHTELLRVMVHGVLHLCGYKDETDAEQCVMRAAEDRWLLKVSG